MAESGKANNILMFDMEGELYGFRAYRNITEAEVEEIIQLQREGRDVTTRLLIYEEEEK